MDDIFIIKAVWLFIEDKKKMRFYLNKTGFDNKREIIIVINVLA